MKSLNYSLHLHGEGSFEKAKEIAEIIYKSEIVDSVLRNNSRNIEGYIKNIKYCNSIYETYMLFYELNQKQRCQKYKLFLNSMDQIIFNQNFEIKTQQEYDNNLNVLYILSKKIKKKRLIYDKLIAQKIVSNIKVYYQATVFFSTWQSGRASLLKICITLYSLDPSRNTKNFIEELIEDIDINDVNAVNFYYGYAGIVYSLCFASEVFPANKRIAIKLKKAFTMMESIDYIYDGTNTSWNVGLVGVGISLQKAMEVKLLDKYSDFDKYQDLLDAVLYEFDENDIINNQLSASLELFHNSMSDSRLDKSLKDKIERLILEQCSRQLYHISYLDNASGDTPISMLVDVSYSLLRNSNNKVSNILCLD